MLDAEAVCAGAAPMPARLMAASRYAAGLRNRDLNIVPHTALETTVGQWQPGVQVNLEVDVIARYLERLLLGEKAADPQQEGGITLGFLAENGFLK